MPEKVKTYFGDSDDEPVKQAPNAPAEPAIEEPGRKKKRNKKRKRDEPTDEPPSRDDKPVTQEAPHKSKSPTNEKPESIPEQPGNEDNVVGKAHPGKPPSNSKHNSKPKSLDNKTNFTSLREKANTLYEQRKKLPIFGHSDEIRKKLRDQDVMLLVGETGSGKSTQIPQFLVNEFWCRPTDTKITQKDGKEKSIKVGGCIAITQPRRVAAISLARRVAEEMGTPLGSSSPASKVGYSVRFDTSTSPSTRVKFLTEGMLLQEMLHDPWLTKYSAVVVDEVHERGVNVDLVTGFLRNLVSCDNQGRGGVPLKVVVMSATADMESLQGFFQEGFKLQAEEQKRIENGSAKGEKENGVTKDISVCHIKGRQFSVKTIYSPEPVHDFVDAALKIIFQIHYKEPMPGDILVFLTGQETVEALEHLVNEYAIDMDPALPKVQVLPLFAALPQAAQQRVFMPAPPRTRKIVLSTNIAETSVTVSGVRYVVDCGKAKIKQFRSRLGLDSLLVKLLMRLIPPKSYDVI